MFYAPLRDEIIYIKNTKKVIVAPNCKSAIAGENCIDFRSMISAKKFVTKPHSLLRYPPANLSTVGDDFGYRCKNLDDLSYMRVISVGNNFCAYSSVKYVHPYITRVGDNFCYETGITNLAYMKVLLEYGNNFCPTCCNFSPPGVYMYPRAPLIREPLPPHLQTIVNTVPCIGAATHVDSRLKTMW